MPNTGVVMNRFLTRPWVERLTGTSCWIMKCESDLDVLFSLLHHKIVKGGLYTTQFSAKLPTINGFFFLDSYHDTV